MGLYLRFPSDHILGLNLEVLPLLDKESGDLHPTPGFHYCIPTT